MSFFHWPRCKVNTMRYRWNANVHGGRTRLLGLGLRLSHFHDLSSPSRLLPEEKTAHRYYNGCTYRSITHTSCNPSGCTIVWLSSFLLLSHSVWSTREHVKWRDETIARPQRLAAMISSSGGVVRFSLKFSCFLQSHIHENVSWNDSLIFNPRYLKKYPKKLKWRQSNVNSTRRCSVSLYHSSPGNWLIVDYLGSSKRLLK